MNRGILELKSDTRILQTDALFRNKTCYFLSALFAKAKIYFCRYNFGNKQLNKNS